MEREWLKAMRASGGWHRAREKPAGSWDVALSRTASDQGLMLEALPTRRDVTCLESLLNVSIVEDDEAVRKSLKNLLRSAGHRVELFASAEEFSRPPRRRALTSLSPTSNWPALPASKSRAA